MNYRHIYHAGCFADVFKHIVVILILESLLNKDKPFCYIDTHSGIGKYDLKSTQAQKTKEYEVGIKEIFNSQIQKPAAIEKYLAIVSSLNSDNKLRYYPGSPRFARALIRPGDKMILSELHAEDHQTLKQEFWADKQVAVHLSDGYLGLKAFLPPDPRRGMVLIDPPFEKIDEFHAIFKGLKTALERWQEGIYAVWYPIKKRGDITRFHSNLKRLNYKQILITELNLFPEDSPMGLNGSGLAIINPPFQLKQKLQQVVPWLLKVLDKHGHGNYKIE